MKNTETEVAIIGAGPIGLELAVEFRRLNVTYRQFEAGQIGSTIEWFAPGTTFFSSPERIAIAGVPLEVPNQGKATREEYLRYLRAVTAQFNLRVETYREVRTIKPREGRFELSIGKSHSGFGAPGHHAPGPLSEVDETVTCSRLVLAFGDMHRPQLLHVPGEDLPHVSHYLKDPHTYFRKHVLIVGGRNSAVEAALRLYRSGALATLCFRTAELPKHEIKYWLYPEIVHLIRTQQIACFPSTTVREIKEEAALLSAAPGGSVSIESDFVLLLTGYEQEQSLFALAGVHIDAADGRPAYSPETMETNVPGVFVAGTAAAGRSKKRGYREFIETAHVHVERIVRAMGLTPSGSFGQDIPQELRES